MALERKALGLLFWGAQMLKRITGLLVCFLPILTAAQNGAIQGHSYLGGTKAVTSGLSSVNYMDGIIPSATITVYLTGTTTLATIYSNSTGTHLANPFTSNTSASVDPGGWIFWAAANNGLDVVMSGGVSPNTYTNPITLVDILPVTGGCDVNSPNDCVITDPTGNQTISQPDGTNFTLQSSDGVAQAIFSPYTDGTYGHSSSAEYDLDLGNGDFDVNANGGVNLNVSSGGGTGAFDVNTGSGGMAFNLDNGGSFSLNGSYLGANVQNSIDMSSETGISLSDDGGSGGDGVFIFEGGTTPIEIENGGSANVSIDSGAGISIDDSSSTGIAIDSTSGNISLGGDMAYLFSSATPGSGGPDCLQIATTGLITNTGSTCGTINTGGTGLSASGSTLNSNAVYEISFQPGMLTSVVSTKSAYSKVSVASTVDNITGSAMSLTCGTNPTITLYECGTSATCASPTTMGSVTLSATGTATSGTLSSTSIAAGDYVAWSISGGTCTVLDIDATAQIHSN